MMAGLIPAEELRKLQKRMSRLMDDLGLTNLESKYLEEMERMHRRMCDLMEDVETAGEEGEVMVPLADVKETDESVVVTMDLPGVEKQEVEISIIDDELRVVAERNAETEVSEKDFHRRERIFKRFERKVRLPVSVRTEEAGAKLSDGVLEIKLPKEVITTRKRISID
jgi:HSP20 family protein